jgi:patatin-like phospholipase/acyl hydrolase
MDRSVNLLALGKLHGFTEHCFIVSESKLSADLYPLDGSGIRGLSELLIVRKIMNRVGYDSGLRQAPRPCKYFDLIGGTSTGG